MSYIQCAASNPFRPPHWRWLRAAGVLNNEQPAPGRRRDGPQGYKWINAAMRFERARAAAVTDTDRAALATRMPAVYWAHHAYTDEHSPMKWDIEAHILARCTDWEIGYHCGAPVEVIEAYENLFFNVRDKLAHKGYILHCVMGPSVHRGLSERDYDLLWKLYGYAYGPHMLRALVTKFANPTWCDSPDSVGSAVQDDTVGTMKMKAALAAKTIPVASGTQVDILQIFTKYVEIERTSDTAGQMQDQILGHIGAMFDTLPLNVAGRDPLNAHSGALRGPVQAYEETAIELSYEETMQVAAGMKLSNEAMLRQMQFPPSPAELEAGAIEA